MNDFKDLSVQDLLNAIGHGYYDDDLKLTPEQLARIVAELLIRVLETSI